MSELEQELHALAMAALGRPLTQPELDLMDAAMACQRAAAALPFDVSARLLRLFD